MVGLSRRHWLKFLPCLQRSSLQATLPSLSLSESSLPQSVEDPAFPVHSNVSFGETARSELQSRLHTLYPRHKAGKYHIGSMARASGDAVQAGRSNTGRVVRAEPQPLGRRPPAVQAMQDAYIDLAKNSACRLGRRQRRDPYWRRCPPPEARIS